MIGGDRSKYVVTRDDRRIWKMQRGKRVLFAVLFHKKAKK